MNLTGEQRVRMLLALVPYYQERQYTGNYYDNDDINDVLTAVGRADLTDIQRQIIRLTFFEDLTQSAAGKLIGLSQQMVKYYEARAVTKITEEYEKGNSDEFDGA